MSFLSLIESKRDGQELSATAIHSFIADFVASRIPDYQMAAMLMAIFFRGLSPAETRALTLAMRDSGEVLRFPEDPRPIVDKHSTGGVGDKVSLPLAPLLACLGFRVPMISGRGLGITGGTLDKLESIPGFTTQLDPARIVTQTQSLGLAMAGQTTAMIPADRLLYSLRDVTGTVPSIPLITASILSKKLAEGLQALVMDVKFGNAAFMTNREDARKLAQSIVSLANECGLNTRALLTDMNTPVGRAAGNWLEVKEAVACLEGKGPADLAELVIECAASLLVQTRRAPDLESARRDASRALDSGRPREKWNELLSAQGADLRAFNRQLALDPVAPAVADVTAPSAGYVTRCEAQLVGAVVRNLGGGRFTKETIIRFDVGVDHLAKLGECVAAGARLCRVHAATADQAQQAANRLSEAFTIAAAPPSLEPAIVEFL